MRRIPLVEQIRTSVDNDTYEYDNHFMVLTASKLRQDVYRILDRVAETGAPVEVRRRGKRLRISLFGGPGKLSRLPSRKVLRVDRDTIVHMDWSDEWTTK